MKRYVAPCVAALSICFPVEAEEFVFANKLSVFSEYYSRGFSQTREMVAPQFMSTVLHGSGLFGGMFVSRVEFLDGDEADMELDFFAGYQQWVDEFYYRTAFIYYAFPDARSSLKYNFWELDLGLGYQFAHAYSEISLKTSPNHFADSGQNRYAKWELHVPVHEQVKVKSHLAHRYIEDNAAFYGVPDSFDWEIGLEYKPVPSVDLILKYVDSTLTEVECFGTDFCSERLIAGISYHF